MSSFPAEQLFNSLLSVHSPVVVNVLTFYICSFQLKLLTVIFLNSVSVYFGNI